MARLSGNMLCDQAAKQPQAPLSNTEWSLWLQRRCSIVSVRPFCRLTGNPRSLWAYGAAAHIYCQVQFMVVSPPNLRGVETKGLGEHWVNEWPHSLVADGRKLLLYEPLDVDHFLQRNKKMQTVTPTEWEVLLLLRKDCLQTDLWTGTVR